MISVGQTNVLKIQKNKQNSNQSQNHRTIYKNTIYLRIHTDKSNSAFDSHRYADDAMHAQFHNTSAFIEPTNEANGTVISISIGCE